MSNIKWIDATIWKMDVIDENVWITELDKVFERYAFGRETAPTTGQEHYQFRGILKNPLSADGVNYLSHIGFRHITPTSVRNFDYVFKDGNYYTSWDKPRAEYQNACLRDWQLQLRDLPRDDRSIEIIYDWNGNTGKTFCARLFESQHRATYVPPLTRGLDICACVMSKPKSGWYLIDCPASFSLDNREVWSAIEQIKNGYVYDPRYTFKCLDIGFNPRVTVLTNTLPSRIPLSLDRIKLYTICYDSLYDRYILQERPDLIPVEE